MANIVCFRHVPDGINDLGTFQARIRDEMVRRGDFYILETRLPSGVHLRITIINDRTTEDDLRDLVTAIRDSGQAVRG